MVYKISWNSHVVMNIVVLLRNYLVFSCLHGWRYVYVLNCGLITHNYFFQHIIIPWWGSFFTTPQSMSILGKTAKMAPLPGEACTNCTGGFSKNKVELHSILCPWPWSTRVYEKRTKSCVFCSSLQEWGHIQRARNTTYSVTFYVLTERKHESQ